MPLETTVFANRSACCVLRRVSARACGGLLSAVLVILPTEAAPLPPTVVVVYSSSRLLPANIEADRGLRQAMRPAAGRRVQVIDEFLDMPRLGGRAYEDTLRSYLRDKYAPRLPAVLVAAGDPALVFLLKNRDRLFPGVVVVHMGVTPAALRALTPLPADVIGVPMALEASRTVAQALRWHPQARQVVVVTGSSSQDLAFETELRAELPRAAAPAAVEFWAGLPRSALLERLTALKSDSVVFTPGLYQDGDRDDYTPREAAQAIATAAAAAAPVYAPFNTFLGTGVVGGFVLNFEALGRQAGEMANALLGGTAPALLASASRVPSTLTVDWRQVQRWGIAESDLPHDTQVQFRVPGFFELHRIEVAVTAAVILLQTTLIGGLLVERRRRRRIETVEMKQRFELAHASRLAVAGELTGAIAHEINQPLGAILANADTAELMLESDSVPREALRRIVADIRRDNQRASQVIRRLRSLLAKHEVERRPFDLSEATQEVVSLLQSEAQRRGVAVELNCAPGNVTVVGDRIQVQQVLINLMLNAMDATSPLPEARRSLTLGIARDAELARVTVRDNGPGIPTEHLGQLFESFFSTKRKGMGLGLSIARTLVEAHGGQIRAENGEGGGALFTVTLPLTASPGIDTEESA
jgi:signal transduction histidine kinase